MELPIENIVQDIHQSQLKMCMAVAGAGNQAVNWLLNVPGASNTILDVSIPYSENAMSALLGQLPESIVSEETACAIAVERFIKAKKYSENSTNAIGVGCTATIATNREKRGQHRAIIAVCSSDKLCIISLILNKGARTRLEEDLVVSNLLLHVISSYAGLEFNIAHVLLDNEVVNHSDVTSSQCLDLLIAGYIPYVILRPDGSVEYALPSEKSHIIFPGSFNPLHAGHKTLSDVVEREYGLSSLYETSIVNVDKPPLSHDEIMRRVSQFEDTDKLLVTNQATFVGKAKCLGRYNFLVGWDTAKRLLEEKYYNNQSHMWESLAYILANGNQFYVAGRVNEDGFNSKSDLVIPRVLDDLFVGISEDLFRLDISSTEIRESE